MIDPEIRLDALARLAESIAKDVVPQGGETHRYDTLCYHFTMSVVGQLAKGVPIRLGPTNKLYRFLRDVGRLGILEPFLEKKP